MLVSTLSKIPSSSVSGSNGSVPLLLSRTSDRPSPSLSLYISNGSTSYASITPSPSESKVLLKNGISKYATTTISFSGIINILESSPSNSLA